MRNISAVTVGQIVEKKNQEGEESRENDMDRADNRIDDWWGSRFSLSSAYEG
jgi:hypothetical protein